MRTGDHATWRDQITKKVLIVEVLEPVRFMVGPVQTGTGFNVRDILTGCHWTATERSLKPVIATENHPG